MPMIECPCCAGAGKISLDVPEALPGLERLIFETVAKSKTAGTSTDALVDAIYGHRADGGPDFAKKAIHVRIWRINKRLAPAGLAVRSDNCGASSVYRVVSI